MSDDDKDLLQDLQFLFANDDQLQEDLANVCDLLLDGTSTGLDVDPVARNTSLTPRLTTSPLHNHDATMVPPNPIKLTKDPRRFEVRQREEIFHLRHQVEMLKMQLNSHGKHELATPSKWERLAMIESVEKDKVLRENERLREQVFRQATFIEQMEKFCRKRPRLQSNDIQSEEWQSYRLVAQKSLRVAAIHAIADRQLHRMQSTFIKTGIFDTSKYVLRINFVPQPGGSGLVEFVNNIVLAAPFDTIGAIAWGIQGNETPVELPEGVSQEMEIIDEKTIYIVNKDARNRSFSNTIRKRYVEPYRHVIVQRTVQEDALMPQMNRGAVENKSSWMEITPLPEDATKSRMAFVMYLEIGELPDKNDPAMKLMESIIERFTIDHKPLLPGTFPPATSTKMVDTTAIPFVHVRSCAEREKLMMSAMAHSVNNAINKYMLDSHNALKAIRQ
ncbi:unnamed protein product [Aphanomyces euteiches]|uniref:START domain-containing protein n=1 Tax=Aphanomyces euteiches TaxID=100861 RepID=A0A6G0X7F0_9STRA|nr:hypothetical protein Ae201684_007688 [Aphanomyces euteiches]KAH9154071.1 hypothetical protein AeRB84_003769 [Aphanomyces euteiches]